MRPAEFLEIAADMQDRWWAFPIPREALERYGADLADMDAGPVRAALDSLWVEGAKNPPTAGQIRRRVVEMEIDAPAWEDARRALWLWWKQRHDRASAARGWECPLGMCDGSAWIETGERTVGRCECRPQYLDVLRGMADLHPLVREFLSDEHVAAGELDRVFGDGSTTAESQLRVRWQQFAGRAIDSRVLAGMPGAPSVRRIEAARAEDEVRASRGGEPRRLDGGRMLALIERGAR